MMALRMRLFLCFLLSFSWLGCEGPAPPPAAPVAAAPKPVESDPKPPGHAKPVTAPSDWLKPTEKNIAERPEQPLTTDDDSTVDSAVNEETAPSTDKPKPASAGLKGIQLRKAFQIGKHKITSLSFSPDGSQIAVGSLDTAVQIWDSMTGEMIKEIPSPEGEDDFFGPAQVAWSPDGTYLAIGAKERVQLYSLKNDAWEEPNPKLRVKQGESVQTLVWFGDDRLIAGYGGPESGYYALLDLPTGATVIKAGHQDENICAAVSYDRKKYILSFKNLLTLHNGKTNKPIGSPFLVGLPVELKIKSIAISSDGKRIAAANGRSVHQFEPTKAGFVQQFAITPAGGASIVNYSPDGSKLIVLGGAFSVFDAAEASMVAGKRAEAKVAAFTPDSKILATTNQETAEVSIWDLYIEMGEFAPADETSTTDTAAEDNGPELEGEWISYRGSRHGKEDPNMINGRVVFRGKTVVITSPTGDTTKATFVADHDADPKTINLVVSQSSGSVKVLGLYRFFGDSLELCTGDPNGPRPPADFSSHTVLLLKRSEASATDTTAANGEEHAAADPQVEVKKIDPKLTLQASFPGGANSVSAISFSPDGKQYAVAIRKAPTQIRSMATNEIIKEIPFFMTSEDSNWFENIVAWSPDGKTLAISQNYDLGLYSVEKSKWLSEKFEPRRYNIKSLQWVGNDRLLIRDGGPRDGKASLITIPPGKTLYEHELQHLLESPVITSADGKTLAVGSGGMLQLVDIETQQPSPQQVVGEKNSEDEFGRLAFSPDGKLLAASQFENMTVFEITPEGMKQHLKLDDLKSAKYLAFTPGGKYLVFAGSRIGVLDLETGKEVATSVEIPAFLAALSRDGKTLITADNQKALYRIDLSSIIANDNAPITTTVVPTLPEPADSPVGDSPSGFRTWTSADGKFKIEAKLLSVIDNVAQLERADGKISKVPVDKLSEADQQFIADNATE